MAVGFPAKTDFATGDVLTATNVNDITGTLNLLQSTLYPAGRNKIINGDFNINQRNFTSTTADGYNFDQWIGVISDGTVTFSAQTFTPGTAPVAGYEGKNYLRCVTTGQTLTTARANIAQRIESVRTLAGQTAIVSFWAKANTGTPEIGMQLQQNFGTGGSPSASVNTSSKVTISTSWARYSLTFSVPSISGKTLGTNNNDTLTLQTWFSGGSSFTALSGGIAIQNNTFELWGVQLEAASTGSTASPFQTASGSIAGELALCQRYFQTFPSDGATSGAAVGQFYSTTAARLNRQLPVTMRAAGTATFPTVYASAIEEVGVAYRTPTAYSVVYAGPDTLAFNATGMTGAVANAGAAYVLSNKISVSAEL